MIFKLFQMSIVSVQNLLASSARSCSPARGLVLVLQPPRSPRGARSHPDPSSNTLQHLPRPPASIHRHLAKRTKSCPCCLSLLPFPSALCNAGAGSRCWHLGACAGRYPRSRGDHAACSSSSATCSAQLLSVHQVVCSLFSNGFHLLVTVDFLRGGRLLKHR